MRKSFLLLAALALVTGLRAQTMADALHNACTLTWVGLDFSQAKFVPPVEFAEVEADPTLALLKWNNLLEQEPEKYDLGKALGITRCVTNTSYMRVVNEGLTAADLLGRVPYRLDESKIPEMVNAYSTEGEGVGVVFIVSTFDKKEVLAEFHIVFFNMTTREVLHSERITGKPGGFGIRNYWAGAVYDVLKKITKNYGKVWRQRYK